MTAIKLFAYDGVKSLIGAIIFNQLTQIVMKGKYINESWYIVFDGTSYYGVLGMDVEDTLQEDSDIEVVSGPYKEYPEEKIEQLNESV